MSFLEKLFKSEPKVGAHMSIRGQVREARFPFFVEHVARELHIQGEIKIVAHHQMNVDIEAPKDTIMKFVEEIRQKSPKNAMIEAIEMGWKPYTGRFQSFTVSL